MDTEAYTLIRENDAMLKRICAYIDKVDSRQYKESEGLRAFPINMCADIAVDNTKYRIVITTP